jgi:putative spermidine/putrescine transport system permease protein
MHPPAATVGPGSGGDVDSQQRPSRRSRAKVVVDQLNRPVLVKLLAAVAFVVLLAPSVVIVVAGFNSGDYLGIPPDGFSMRWVTAFLTGSLFTSWLFSFGLALNSTVIASVLGVLAALSFERGVLRRVPWLRGVFFAPMAIPGIVFGFALLITYVLVFPGLYRTYPGLVVGHVVILMPYVVSTVGASLTTIEPSLEQAARSLGASPQTVFWRITLPLLAPGISAGALFGFVVSFGQYDLSIFLSTPDLTPLPIALYEKMRFQFDPTIAGAGIFAIAQLALTLLIINRLFGLSKVTNALSR